MTNNIPTCTNSCGEYRQLIDSSLQERTFIIEKLVQTYANVIDSIWQPKYFKNSTNTIMPTQRFCAEILKRSRTTYSTLQVSLFYIFRIKNAVTEKLANNPDDLICCGRRMFLASLMVASKYLHDKNYHNKTWATITGLNIKEINAAELTFLKLIDYKLHVSKPTFDRWYAELHGHIQKEYKAASNYPSPTRMTLPFATNDHEPPPTLILASPPIHTAVMHDRPTPESKFSEPALISPPITKLPSADSDISINRPEYTSLKRKHNEPLNNHKKYRC